MMISLEFSLTHTYVSVHAVFGKGEKVGKVR